MTSAPTTPSRTGVILINTGTPDAPEEGAIARYLDEFLMDPALIGAPWPIRRLIVNRIVATRPAQTVERYRSFWTQEGSPFLLTCQTQARLLATRLASHGVTVALAMRYGNPSIQGALQQLRDQGCTRIVALPCYPQFTKVCAGTCLTAIKKALKAMAWHPALIEVKEFYQQPHYRAALAETVRQAWTTDSTLVVSCHSTLLKDIEAGDPYRNQVEATAANLAEDLGIDAGEIRVSYQSRFDNRKWLGPSTKQVVTELAQQGKSVTILCPIFVADNMETLVEVEVDLRQTYLEHAQDQTTFTYVQCLNDHPGLIEAWADAIESVLEP